MNLVYALMLFNINRLHFYTLVIVKYHPSFLTSLIVNHSYAIFSGITQFAAAESIKRRHNSSPIGGSPLGTPPLRSLIVASPPAAAQVTDPTQLSLSLMITILYLSLSLYLLLSINTCLFSLSLSHSLCSLSLC